MIRLKSIGNCPVTGADVDRFYEMYGGVRGPLRGKPLEKRLLKLTSIKLSLKFREKLRRDSVTSHYRWIFFLWIVCRF